MILFTTLAILITLTAVFAFLNDQYIRLPTTIGVMLIALLFSIALVALGQAGALQLDDQVRELLRTVDFSVVLLQGMLAFLLFAGALHVDLDALSRHGWTIAILATMGVTISTFAIGGLIYWASAALGLPLPFLYCLLFGALISPTDPIAVLGLLKSAGVPEDLEVQVTGESLFNDGVGVVLFLILLEIATGHEPIGALDVARLFAQEAIGGGLLGLGAGLIAFWMLRRVENYQVEVLITLALVMGGYAFAQSLHMSGPIAIVVAGLLVGNHGRLLAMSETTREHLDTFWELVDEILNAVLFVLIGLEVLIIRFSPSLFFLGAVAIAAVLLVRGTVVGGILTVLGRFLGVARGAIPVLTWAGLRGGISVALALSLPPGPERDVLLPAAYAVVIFSIVVQGLTIRRVARWATGAAASGTDDAPGPPPRVA